MSETKLTYKVCIKSEYTRADGTNALYLNIYIGGKRKRLPLNISVPKKYFDKKKQRVFKNYKYRDDYNLLIEKVLADLNTIEVNYRLINETPTLEKIIEDLTNPSLRINYNQFATDYLLKTKSSLKNSTYLQQQGILNKIKEYKNPILFNEINEQWLMDFKSYLKTKLKNKPVTVESTLKTFKKYLRAANDRGIKTDLTYKDISIKRMVGDFTFLMPDEVNTLYKFYNSPFINETWRNVLQRYLFSCFTGLRISDIENLTKENFVDGNLVFITSKNGKLSRIKLNKTALSIIELPMVFGGKYSRKHINEELKNIARAVGINKRIYFHSSRHTFATNYLISGGKIQNLQKILTHSDIKTTMVYAHVVDSIMDEEIVLLDSITHEND